jgi:hypothetical protein
MLGDKNDFVHTCPPFPRARLAYGVADLKLPSPHYKNWAMGVVWLSGAIRWASQALATGVGGVRRLAQETNCATKAEGRGGAL